MNDITDDAIMSALGRQMAIAVAKQTAAAGNLANLDTPGYRAKEAVFDDALTQELRKHGMSPLRTASSSGPVATHPDHLGARTAAKPAATDIEDLQARRDGNNVQLDRELLQMTQAAGDFAAAKTVLAAKFRLIRYAIDEGR